MTFVLVRKEPDDAMRYAGIEADDAPDETIGHVGSIYRAMIAASLPPTDEELDELCRLWFGEDEYWDRAIDEELAAHSKTPSARRCIDLRNADRARMSAFLSALTGQRP